MTKLIYVTGCCGFIGSHVTRQLLKEGCYVRGIDKMTYAANQEFLNEFNNHENFTFEKKDINDLKFLYDCDYIINTAAETHVDNSIVRSDDFIHSNINGVHNLLELIRKNHHFKMPTLLHFSTDEVYGDIVRGDHKETDLLKPSNPYSATKAAADMLIQAWHRTYNVPYILVRPTNNYGIGQYVEKLIPKACKFLSLGRKVSMHDRGMPYRNWLHAEDTARAISLIIKSDVVNEIYNISGGYEQKNIDAFKKILNEYFKEEVTDWKKYADLTLVRPGQDVRYGIDDSKLRELGWLPVKIFDWEIKIIVAHYKERLIW